MPPMPLASRTTAVPAVRSCDIRALKTENALPIGNFNEETGEAGVAVAGWKASASSFF